MFSFIRRHQALAMVFMLLVIASFVLFYTDHSHLDLGGGKVEIGSIDGVSITPQEYMAAEKEAMLMHFFFRGDWPNSFSTQMGWSTERAAMERLLLAKRLEELNVMVSEEAVAKRVAQYFRSSDPQVTVQARFRGFVEGTLQPKGLNEEDFRRFIKHELGKNQLGQALGAGGRLVTKGMAETAYSFENQRVEAKLVNFSASNYLAQAKLSIDPKALAQYYTNQMQNYNLPTRVQVSYVAFESINFLAEAAVEMAKITNLTALIEQDYKERGTNFFVDEQKQVLAPEKAKEKIRDEIRTRFASQLARRKAYEFATELYEVEPLAVANLLKLAEKKGLKVLETEPFSNLDGPKGIKSSSQFAQQAFGLNREQPFGQEPVEAGGDYYVLGFKNRLPSVPQPFEAVKAQVEQDYVKYRAVQLAREAGEKFAQAVTTGAATGKTFADIAKEQKVKLLSLAPFARSNRGMIPELETLRVSADQVRAAAFAQKAGTTSGFTPATEGGFVLHVERYLPVDPVKMQAEINDYVETLRGRQANLAFNDWISGQFESSVLTSLGQK